MAEENDNGETSRTLPDEVIETRAVEIVDYLADGSLDELSYFENAHPKLSASNIQTNWNDMTGTFGAFDGITESRVDREEVDDRVIARVLFSLGDFDLKAKVVFDEYGQITGIWFSRADERSVLDRVGESARVVRHGINKTASKFGNHDDEQ